MFECNGKVGNKQVKGLMVIVPIKTIYLIQLKLLIYFILDEYIFIILFFSVVGLNFDFLALNIVGFSLYSIFNLGLYFIPEIEVRNRNISFAFWFNKLSKKNEKYTNMLI